MSKVLLQLIVQSTVVGTVYGRSVPQRILSPCVCMGTGAADLWHSVSGLHVYLPWGIHRVGVLCARLGQAGFAGALCLPASGALHLLCHLVRFLEAVTQKDASYSPATSWLVGVESGYLCFGGHLFRGNKRKSSSE